ncbi:hypothetical protein [Sphingomonas beigongshangi]|uniref:hypothetical protein n=1 Tax=Sphingomonas beigongshangi TaxID=2782540 RepID=UPI00193AF965|nr:hypothetical protein [Sphingomonas beigongshangi]
MTPPIDPLPQDMRDLLVRLDQRVADGFTDMRAKLDLMDKRADSLEQRVVTLERDTANRPFLITQHNQMLNDVSTLKDWRLKTDAQIDGATKMAGWIKGAGVGLIAILGYFGYQLEFNTPDAATAKTVHTVTIPQ